MKSFIDSLIEQIEEGYKNAVLYGAHAIPMEDEDDGLFPSSELRRMLRQEIYVSLPIPRSILRDEGLTVEEIAAKVAERPFVVRAYRNETALVTDKDGEIVFDGRDENMEILATVCKPFKDVRLS